MNRKFISKISAANFSKDLGIRHVKYVEESMKVELVLKKLQKMLPNFIVEVSEKESLLDDARMQPVSKELSKVLYVKITGIAHKGALSFAISNEIESLNGRLATFQSLDQALEYIHRIQKKIKEATLVLNIFANEYIESLEEVYAAEVIQVLDTNNRGLLIKYNMINKDHHIEQFTDFFLPFEDNKTTIEQLLQVHLKELAERICK